MKKIDLNEAQDIANRYVKCMKKISNCVKPCKNCKHNWKDYELKRLCEFVINLKERNNESKHD